jgi:hypothetical protein
MIFIWGIMDIDEYYGMGKGGKAMGYSNGFFTGIIAVCIILIPVACNCDYVPREGFVTLEFSDSHYMDYTGIFPMLESYGLKASFAYITEISQLGIEHDAWMMQEIYLAGHEVQDHTTRHDYMWASHIDTVEDGVTDWVPYTFADVATWDSLCERSLFIIDSLGIEDVIGWGHPGGGVNAVVPGHPTWRWRGMQNDSLYDLISTKFPYALVGGGVHPHTAHLNLRGHNCPDRYPFFCVAHNTIDTKGAEEVKTALADAVAGGLWYLMQSHVWKLPRVAKMESLLEWLDTTDIEILTCVDGWQRIAYGQPDPFANQFPQARMLKDYDGNNKPDGFLGSCSWDTTTAAPVDSAMCMLVSGDTQFYCFGPELGPTALSLWLKSTGSSTDTLLVVWAKIDFDFTYMDDDVTAVPVPTEWTRIDTSEYADFLINVEDEVDRIRIRLLPTNPVLVAYPEMALIATAGAEPVGRGADGMHSLVVTPNPVRCGEAVTIAPARNVVLYDVLGRYVLAPRPFRSGDALVIDTARLAPGVYFITGGHPQQDSAHLVVVR